MSVWIVSVNMMFSVLLMVSLFNTHTYRNRSSWNLQHVAQSPIEASMCYKEDVDDTRGCVAPQVQPNYLLTTFIASNAKMSLQFPMEVVLRDRRDLEKVQVTVNGIHTNFNLTSVELLDDEGRSIASKHTKESALPIQTTTNFTLSMAPGMLHHFPMFISTVRIETQNHIGVSVSVTLESPTTNLIVAHVVYRLGSALALVVFGVVFGLSINLFILPVDDMVLLQIGFVIQVWNVMYPSSTFLHMCGSVLMFSVPATCAARFGCILHAELCDKHGVTTSQLDAWMAAYYNWHRRITSESHEARKLRPWAVLLAMCALTLQASFVAVMGEVVDVLCYMWTFAALTTTVAVCFDEMQVQAAFQTLEYPLPQYMTQRDVR